MQRLSNDQLAEKMRAANRRRSERQRAKRVEAGRAALTVWIPAELQRQIVELATAEQATTSVVAERLFIAGINALAEPAKPADSVDKAADYWRKQDLTAFKQAVVKFWNAGMRSYAEIAAALEKAGFRNSAGNPYPRSHVKAVLVKAGLVAEPGKATKEDE